MLDNQVLLGAISAFADDLPPEDATAERMLRPLLQSNYRFTYANIARKRRFQTKGVVRVLCRTAAEQYAHEPLFALSLAETATVIAGHLADCDDLLGHAWKEVSNACRALRRTDAALDALDRAERAYRGARDADLRLAAVELCRAMLHCEREEHDVALWDARSAAARFRARGDMRNYLEATICEAGILTRNGDSNAAIKTYRAAYQFAGVIAEHEMKARAATALAGLQPGSATQYRVVALQLYAQLGDRAMVAHTRWSIARLASPAEVTQRLPSIIDELLRFGMAAAAAQARLDLAEAFLLLERFKEAEEVCSCLAASDRDAAALTGATKATSFLEHAAKKRTLERGDIEHVRQYLGALEHSPDLPFTPR